MKTMNKLLSALFVLVTLISTSCLKNNDPGPYVPKAALKIVNAYTNADALVFTVDNNYITPPNVPIRYNEYTSNVALIFPGNKNFKAYSVDNKLVSDTTITLRDSTYYTSFVFGNGEKAKNIITTDVSLGNINTNVALRFLHLASNLGNVNVYLDNTTSTPIYPNVAPEVLSANNTAANTAFKAQTSGKRKVIITDMNNTPIIEREHDFIQSRYYSIIISGDNNSTSKPIYLGIIQQ